MIRVSLGMSASTSAAVKCRSATKTPVHEDRVHFLGPVHSARQGELDVRSPARTRDEVDDGAIGGPAAPPRAGPPKNAAPGRRFGPPAADETGGRGRWPAPARWRAGRG